MRLKKLYRASKNRAVPRAGTMGRGGGPGTIYRPIVSG
jgi:hypothetical protein